MNLVCLDGQWRGSFFKSIKLILKDLAGMYNMADLTICISDAEGLWSFNT